MAAEEVECVRADYEEQLQQTRQMAESAKEESEEQHCKVQNLERGVAQNAKELEQGLIQVNGIRNWNADKEKWSTDME